MTADELAAMIAEEIDNNSGTRAILAKVQRGMATLADSERFTGITAEITGQLLADNVLSLPLSDRQGAFVDITAARYRDTFSVFSAVQRALDERLGINLAVIDPGFEKARAQKAGHALADQTVPESTVVRRAESAGENIVRSQHDRIVQKQAEFRDRAGLSCSAIREGGAKCCEWCASVSGKYPASDTPQGFWGRHDNCKCSILYETRKGVQRLGGSTKKWEPLEDAGAPEPVRFTAEQATEISKKKGLHVLTNNAEHDTMDLVADSSSIYHDITDDSIAALPVLDIFENAEMNKKYHTACVDLLRAAKNYEAGTELSIVYDSKMDRIKGSEYVVGGIGHVAIKNPMEPCHAFHNHGSGETLSFTDIRKFVMTDNFLSISAVGNTGTIFSLIADTNADRLSYKYYLSNKGNQVFFEYKGERFSLIRLSDKKQSELLEALIEEMNEDEVAILAERIIKQTEICIKGGERFGFHYKKGTP